MDKLRPTPETDAFVQTAFGADGLGEDYDAYADAVKLARKLERERDKMREAIKETHDALTALNDIYCDNQSTIANTALTKLKPFLT